MDKQSLDACAPAFEQFVGKPYARSKVEFFMYYPTERSWELLGDHTVICAVLDPEKRTYGTLEGSRR